MTRKRLAVVGNGMAAGRLLDELLRRNAHTLFDIAVGDDNIFRGDKYKWSLRLTAINVTNKVALFNFLSTFSGTHFLTPRTYTTELGFHF